MERRQLFFVFLLLETNAQKQAKRPLPFPHLTNFTLEDINQPVFIFEGVNYEELPQNLSDAYTDCTADYIRCSRIVTYHHPVCGYDVFLWKYFYFHSYCELEYRNCMDTEVKDRRYHLMGDGFICEFTRRFESDSFKRVLLQLN